MHGKSGNLMTYKRILGFFLTNLAKSWWPKTMWKIFQSHFTPAFPKWNFYTMPITSWARLVVEFPFTFEIEFKVRKLHSLKLTAKAPENGWLEYFLVSFWGV